MKNLNQTPSETKEFADLYPQRRSGDKVEFSMKDTWYGHSREQALKNVCHDRIIYNLEHQPMIRNILGALESVGCPVDLDRHFLCDVCTVGTDPMMNYGGYDDTNNQIFVCANNTNSTGHMHALLIRNLIAMFDRCMMKYDFKNPEHLACTEIRKANLAGCEYVNYLRRTDAQFAVRGMHKECVKNTAVESLVKAKFVPKEVAIEAVDRVFNRCYNDLEPIGRRSRNGNDIKMAHAERFLCHYE